MEIPQTRYQIKGNVVGFIYFARLINKLQEEVIMERFNVKDMLKFP